MIEKLNKQQREFCWYYAEYENAHLAAIKAGYAKTTARNYSYKWLKQSKYIECVNAFKVEKDNRYSFEKYIKDLDKVQKIAEENENAALLLKIIEAKAKAYGFNSSAFDDEKMPVEENKPKFDLFKELEKKANVFKKLDQSKKSSKKSNLSADDTG